MGGVLGPEGCIPSYPDGSLQSEVSCVPVQGGVLRIQDSSLRPVYRTQSLHQGCRGGSGRAQEARDTSLCLYRRLADPGSSQSSGNRRSGGDYHPPRISRVGDQQGKVAPHPFKVPQIPRGEDRLRFRPSLPLRGKNPFPERDSGSNSCSPPQSSVHLAEGSGTHGKSSRRRPAMPTAHATLAIPPSDFLQTGFKRPSGPRPSFTRYSPPSHLVDVGSEYGRGDPLWDRASPTCRYDGRFIKRVGRLLQAQDSFRRLVRGGVYAPHKSPGIGGGRSGRQGSGVLGTGQVPNGFLGQYYCGGIHKQTGGHTLSGPLPEGVAPSVMVPTTRHCPSRFSHSREGQCSCGRIVERPCESGRVGFGPGMGGSAVCSLGQAPSGLVCDRGQRKASDVLLENIPPASVGSRCPLFFLGRPRQLRVSPVQHDPQDTAQDQGVEDSCSSHCTPVAEATVVSPHPPPSGGSPFVTPLPSRSDLSGQGESNAPASAGPPAHCMEAIRDSFRASGFPADVAALAARSRRPSTFRTYDSRLSKFRKWCAGRQIDPGSAPVTEVSTFLKLVFDEGKQVSTIKNYRSAIGAIHEGFADGSTLGNNPFVSQLVRGMANVRPRTRVLTPSWSIPAVLASFAKPPFEPLHDVSLADLTHKTLFLIAAASARRRSCLQALSIKPGHCRFENHGVRFVPDPQFIPKNQTLDFFPSDIFIPELKSSVVADKFICPVRSLKWYLQRTEGLRTSQRLFVISKAPYGAASVDTISRWLVEVISPHARGRVRAHEVRGVAASRALFSGVSIQDILRAAAWKTPSTFVACYLTDALTAEASFGRAVLAGTSQSPHQ